MLLLQKLEKSKHVSWPDTNYLRSYYQELPLKWKNCLELRHTPPPPVVHSDFHSSFPMWLGQLGGGWGAHNSLKETVSLYLYCRVPSWKVIRKEMWSLEALDLTLSPSETKWACIHTAFCWLGFAIPLLFSRTAQTFPLEQSPNPNVSLWIETLLKQHW